MYPQAEEESLFGHFFALDRGDVKVGVVHLVVLDPLLRATTKKVVNFLEEKSASPDKILATPMGGIGDLGGKSPVGFRTKLWLEFGNKIP